MVLFNCSFLEVEVKKKATKGNSNPILDRTQKRRNNFSKRKMKVLADKCMAILSYLSSRKLELP